MSDGDDDDDDDDDGWKTEGWKKKGGKLFFPQAKHARNR